jgi:hypothetical protein
LAAPRLDAAVLKYLKLEITASDENAIDNFAIAQIRWIRPV